MEKRLELAGLSLRMFKNSGVHTPAPQAPKTHLSPRADAVWQPSRCTQLPRSTFHDLRLFRTAEHIVNQRTVNVGAPQTDRIE